MKLWKRKFLRLAMKIDDAADNQIYRLRQTIGSINPFIVVPYRTYGTAEKIYVHGRVLEDKKLAVSEDDTLVDNLLNMYKRFETDEVPGVSVVLELDGEQYQVTTDKEGYFVFNIKPATPIITEELYLAFSLHLLNSTYSGADSRVQAEMMIPPAESEYGIISDIDDTIIRTGASDLLSMGKTVLLGTARTRLPFAGVTAFYKALQLGRNGKRNNPFFYVSSSPWNLYDLLTDFMDYNEIPRGPLLLRDFGLQSESFTSGDYMSHKFSEITKILETYPQLNFVLVGDSGEQDPPIYYEVVKHYPGRIICLYIRDVVQGPKQETAKKIAIDLQQLGVEMILAEHTVHAAEHAARIGLIFKEEVPEIIQDKKEDKGQVPGKIEATVL